jgi:hypothetical protein
MMKSCRLWLNVFADLLRFLVLSLRSESALAAENVFPRKQLAFYKERGIRPRRTSHPARLTLSLLLRNSIRVEHHFAAQAVDQLEAEELGAFAQGLELLGAVELMIGGGTGVVVGEGCGHNPID